MKIGITGGIGSGKSTVSAYLKSLGETVICADETARLLTAPGNDGALAIKRTFGDGYFLPDGSLNRKALAAAVFNDEDKRQLLNRTLHPMIIERVMKEAQAQPGRVFIDAALLVQTGLHAQMDAVWLITADKKTRIARVIRRDGSDEQDVLSRMASQPDDNYLKKYAHEIIINDGSSYKLQIKIDKLLNKYVR